MPASRSAPRAARRDMTQPPRPCNDAMVGIPGTAPGTGQRRAAWAWVAVAVAVLDTIAGLRSESRTIILSTHILSEVERLCDDVAVIHHGRLLACDTPTAVMADAAVQEAYVGEAL